MKFTVLKTELIEFFNTSSRDISFLNTQYSQLEDKIEEFYLEYGSGGVDLTDVHNQFNNILHGIKFSNPFLNVFKGRFQEFFKRKAARNSKFHFFDNNYNYEYFLKMQSTDIKIQNLMPKLVKVYNDKIGHANFNKIDFWNEALSLNPNSENTILHYSMLLYLIEKTGYDNDELLNTIINQLVLSKEIETTPSIQSIAEHFKITKLLKMTENQERKQKCKKNLFFAFLLIALRANKKHNFNNLNRKDLCISLINISEQRNETFNLLDHDIKDTIEKFLSRYVKYHTLSAAYITNCFGTVDNDTTYKELVTFISLQNSDIITSSMRQLLDNNSKRQKNNIFGNSYL